MYGILGDCRRRKARIDPHRSSGENKIVVVLTPSIATSVRSVQRFHHLLTSLVFAAHALLGCGVHHVCQNGSAIGERAAQPCSHHDGPAGHREDSPGPADDAQRPSRSGQHTACSFVKADTVRIEHGERYASPIAGPLCLRRMEAVQVGRVECEPICEANLSSTHLYVWHCALLI